MFRPLKAEAYPGNRDAQSRGIEIIMPVAIENRELIKRFWHEYFGI